MFQSERIRRIFSATKTQKEKNYTKRYLTNKSINFQIINILGGYILLVNHQFPYMLRFSRLNRTKRK